MCWVDQYTAKCGCVWDELRWKCGRVTLAAICGQPTRVFSNDTKWANDYCRKHEKLRRQFDATALLWGWKTEHGYGWLSPYAQFLSLTGDLRNNAYYLRNPTLHPDNPFQQGSKHEEEYIEREKNRQLLRMRDLGVFGSLGNETWYSFTLRFRLPQGVRTDAARFQGGPRENQQGIVPLNEIFSNVKEFRDHVGVMGTAQPTQTTSSAALFGRGPAASGNAPATSGCAPTALGSTPTTSSYAPTALGYTPTTSGSVTTVPGFAAPGGQLARKRPPSPSQTAGLRTVPPAQMRPKDTDASQQQAKVGSTATSFGTGSQVGANTPASQANKGYRGPNTSGTVPWGTGDSRLPGRQVGEPSLSATSVSLAPGPSVSSLPAVSRFHDPAQGFINPSMLGVGQTNTSYTPSISQSTYPPKPPSRVASPAIGSNRARSDSPAPPARGSTPQYETGNEFAEAYWDLAREREQSPNAPVAVGTIRGRRGSQTGRGAQGGYGGRGRARSW